MNLGANGVYSNIPVVFTAPSAAVYAITLNVRGGMNLTSANSSLSARLTKSTAPAIPNPELQVMWSAAAGVVQQATASRTYRLTLKEGDVISVEASGFYGGAATPFVASDSFGRTSLTWEQVGK